MRTPFLIAVALIAVPLVGAENPTSKPKSDYIKPFAVADESTELGQFKLVPNKSARRFMSRGDEVCYTMRSMLVVKEQGSDSTEVVGQRTCTPSTQFQMKSTVQRSK